MIEAVEAQLPSAVEPALLEWLSKLRLLRYAPSVAALCTSLDDVAQMDEREIKGLKLKPLEELRMTKAVKALRSRPRFDTMLMMSRNQGVFGVHMGTWNDETVMQEQMENIIKGMKEGALTPIIDSIYDAKDVALAHQHIHDGKNIGKVLLKFVD